MPNPAADAIGLFTAGATFTIPTGTDRVRTSGYRAAGKGAAEYFRWNSSMPALPAPGVGENAWWFTDAFGARWYPNPEELHFDQFGAYGDATASATGTDDLPAWLAAKSCLHYFRRYPDGNTYYKPAPVLRFGISGHRLSNTIDLTDAAYQLHGATNGYAGPGTGTVLFFDAGRSGIILQSWDTQGVSGTKPNTPSGASSSLIRDIHVASRGGTVGAEQHGFLIKCQCLIERCSATDFGGHGFAVLATTSVGLGNANATFIDRCSAGNNGLSGIYLQGADVNACGTIAFQAFQNGTWGICDMSFLGNTHLYFQTDANGTIQAGPSWAPSRRGTYASYGGRIYRVRPGQESAASTTTPGTNGGVWLDQGAGSTWIAPAWASGTPYVSGGAFYAGGVNHGYNGNSRSVFQGYAEPNQASGWFDAEGCVVMPGFSGAENGATLTGFNGGFAANKIGSRTLTNGQYVLNMLGGGGDLLRQFGNTPNDTTVWQEHINTENDVYYTYWNYPPYMPMIMRSGSTSFQPNGRSAPHLAVMQFPNGLYANQSHHTSGTAAPASGNWGRGDIVWNTTPTAGGEGGVDLRRGGKPGHLEGVRRHRRLILGPR